MRASKTVTGETCVNLGCAARRAPSAGLPIRPGSVDFHQTHFLHNIKEENVLRYRDDAMADMLSRKSHGQVPINGRVGHGDSTVHQNARPRQRFRCPG